MDVTDSFDQMHDANGCILLLELAMPQQHLKQVLALQIIQDEASVEVSFKYSVQLHDIWMRL